MMSSAGSAIRVARSITWLLDIVAIASLAAVPEVHPAILIVIGAIFVLRNIGGGVVRLGEGILTILLALISALTIIAILNSHIPIVVAIAHAAPIFHSLLWLARGGLRDLWLRVSGVGFVELILASALTAEFFLPLAIFTFAVASAVMMSSTFIAMSIEEGKDAEQVNIPPQYLRRAMLHAILALVGAVMIFPMLPRGQALGGVDFRQGRVGYTEDVSVTGEKVLEGSGGGNVVLRMFFVDAQGSAFNTELLTDIFLGLVRGRALSHFDGVNWSAANRANRSPARDGALHAPPPTTANASANATNQKPNLVHHFANLELVREPLTEVLPVPYGVKNLWMFSNSGFNVPRRFSTGEWADSSAGSFRVRYRAVLDIEESRLPSGSNTADIPTEDNLAVPAALRSERMLKLAKRLFPDEDASAIDKARALGSFFTGNRFQVSDGTGEDANDASLATAAAGPVTAGWTNLERFLFVRKIGHCELFATATAMLLRLGGVPTRLVSGFRVSHFPSGGVLSVRSGDAHAWVEYWVPGSGWRPLDSTPRLAMPISFVNFFRDRYETLSNYWYRYIFTFDSSRSRSPSPAVGSSTSSRFDGPLERSTRRLFAESRDLVIRALVVTSVLLIITLGIAWTWFPWLFSIRARVRQGPSWLKRERVHMERLLRRRFGVGDLEAALAGAESRFGSDAELAVTRWIEDYYRARFGRGSSDRAVCVRQLREGRQAVAMATSRKPMNRAA